MERAAFSTWLSIEFARSLEYFVTLVGTQASYIVEAIYISILAEEEVIITRHGSLTSVLTSIQPQLSSPLVIYNLVKLRRLSKQSRVGELHKNFDDEKTDSAAVSRPRSGINKNLDLDKIRFFAILSFSSRVDVDSSLAQGDREEDQEGQGEEKGEENGRSVFSRLWFINPGTEMTSVNSEQANHLDSQSIFLP
ncbi:uncharacterized protein ARB_00200 [Trichophyton benhamiae CBS 112371]|uniref:Uncharacterized protein n=1 Tax=Arthroderma benhamiae (strain ATCC MYA-4681 / CBS 112371) TaxID=663331 RepID=D4AVI6_ARTBC|nr:uncharacterized protein ARB_00200 [Trichophyton benhamiae CBS 112371]EFE32742.1 hypothetical protein ARB_00200 [Trichophyton benhamiae CBS 112371]